jgi:hypothetical protein
MRFACCSSTPAITSAFDSSSCPPSARTVYVPLSVFQLFSSRCAAAASAALAVVAGFGRTGAAMTSALVSASLRACESTVCAGMASGRAARVGGV